MKLGVVTSGGDAPGMNAAIRSVVRFAIPRGAKVIGIKRGYAGLLANDTVPLTLRSVGQILQYGGTMLLTSRSPEFQTREGLEKGAEVLKNQGIDGLVVIGGDGSARGALSLSELSGVPCMCIPATIDNDVYGTDETIGFDTAVNTAVEAIDKIRDTAVSLERIFVVEVMGRNRGFLALHVGLAVGASLILVPEIQCPLQTVVNVLEENAERGKTTSIIVAAEGIENTDAVVSYIEKSTEYEVRLSKLGYIQRGGSPTARSRLLADLFGAKAVELLLGGEKNKMVGLDGKN
ncbi:6-phosphofructokinase, partial [Candidatus Bathyarchaeota archaeon]|nr:6-phosphofructokinase [Candidatus Bathyarchaeota archaeon]